MNTDLDRDLLVLVQERFSRIQVAQPRIRQRPGRRSGALAAAAMAGLVLGGSVTVAQASAFADSKGASCADLGTKMAMYLGAARVFQDRYPNFPPGSTVVVTAPDGQKESVRTSPSGNNAEAAPGSVLATGAPTATCMVDGVTVQVYDEGWSMAIRRMLPFLP